MPEGSSSAAPVINPGPRFAKKPFLRTFAVVVAVCEAFLERRRPRLGSDHCKDIYCERRTIQRPLSSSTDVHHQADYKQHDKQEEQDFCDACESNGQSTE